MADAKVCDQCGTVRKKSALASHWVTVDGLSRDFRDLCSKACLATSVALLVAEEEAWRVEDEAWVTAQRGSYETRRQ